MKYIFSNILSILFCENFFLQKQPNVLLFSNNVSIKNDTNFFVQNNTFAFISFNLSTFRLIIEKLPIIAENGGIFSYKVW